MNNTVIRREHDFVLNYLKIVDSLGREFDFSNHYSQFTYEESIFSGTHGTLYAVDGVDYPTLLPMIGEESLKASFTRPDEENLGQLLPPIKFEMPIYNLSGKSQVQGSKKLQTYILKYISPSAINSLKTRVFKAYKSKTYADIVKDVFDNFIKVSDNKPLEIENTFNEVNYTINNERPYDAIKKICKRSISNENNGTMYAFYEDRDKFHFISIGKLLQKPAVRDIRYEIKNIDEASVCQGHKTPDLKRDMYNVSDIFQGTNFDIISSSISGETCSHLISVNPLRRKVVEKSFDLRNEYDKFKHIDKNKRFTNNSKMFNESKSNPMMIISDFGNEQSPYILEKEPNTKTFLFEEYKQYSLSQKQQILRHITKVNLSGDPRIKAGDVINFLLPEFLGKASDSSPEELDRYLQGKYLVAAVSHIIKPNSYTMNLELLKDSFFKEIKARDPLEEYKGII